MNQSEKTVIFNLFQKVHFKCFSTGFITVLSEPDAKHLSNEIFEATGLVIGWKSLKNYSKYLLTNNPVIPINPSLATLDTLVRYIENAPKTGEISRKKFESHYSYWFGFKEKTSAEVHKKNYIEGMPDQKVSGTFRVRSLLTAALILFLCVSVLYIFLFYDKKVTADFVENFENPVKMTEKGWVIRNLDYGYWNKQNPQPSKLVLYTLRGDNFEESDSINGIKNLLVKEISAKSFSGELHISNFVPSENWQQTGIILMEDTISNSRSVRFSLGYNDFFGGFNKPGEIILQVLSSTTGNFMKPEEIIQAPIFQINAGQETLIQRNLRKSAIRIEKSNNVFRFLYAVGEKDIFAFKELKSKELNISPKFIGIYASSGNNRNAAIISVQLEKFIFKVE